MIRLRINAGQRNMEQQVAVLLGFGGVTSPLVLFVTSPLGFFPSNHITMQLSLFSYVNDFPHILLHNPFPSV